MEKEKGNHVGAVFDGLFGVKGAVFASDALADHACALVDEHSRRGRRELAEAMAARGDGGQQSGDGLSSHFCLCFLSEWRM